MKFRASPSLFRHAYALTSIITNRRLIQEQSEDESEMCYVCLATHLNSKWCKVVKTQKSFYKYKIGAAIKSVNISKKEFLKCWGFVRARTPPDEVFSWFKDARFGQRSMKISRRMALRVAFVRRILQRYKDIEVFRIYLYLLFLSLFFLVIFVCFSCAR